MLSDSKAKSKSPVKRKLGVSTEGKKPPYSDSQKMDLVKTYLVTGNLLHSAATLNIPYITAKSWKKSEWWQELVSDIKTEDRVVLSDRLKRIVNRSLDITEERLDNGDWIYDQKTGEMMRKPVSMKDAHKVTVDLIDRREMLEDKPQEQTSVESVAAKLDAIAEKFAMIANAKPKIEVTDVIEMNTVDGHRGTVLEHNIRSAEKEST